MVIIPASLHRKHSTFMMVYCGCRRFSFRSYGLQVKRYLLLPVLQAVLQPLMIVMTTRMKGQSVSSNPILRDMSHEMSHLLPDKAQHYCRWVVNMVL